MISEYLDIADENGFTIAVELPDGPTSAPVEYRALTRAGDDDWIEIARFTVLPGTFSLHEIDNFLQHVRFEPVDPRPDGMPAVVRILPRRDS